MVPWMTTYNTINKPKLEYTSHTLLIPLINKFFHLLLAFELWQDTHSETVKQQWVWQNRGDIPYIHACPEWCERNTTICFVSENGEDLIWGRQAWGHCLQNSLCGLLLLRPQPYMSMKTWTSRSISISHTSHEAGLLHSSTMVLFTVCSNI